MSRNIHQIYIDNPITTNVSTDLMYFGQSPYGIGNDAAMTYANFSTQFSLQTSYNNGSNAHITLSGSRPIQIIQGSEQINFNDTTTNNSVFFSVVSTTRAAHPFPSMTSAQRLAIASPGIGDVVNDTDKGYFYRYNSSQWVQIVTNLPLSPLLDLTNSIGFPNISLGNPPRYYYTISFSVNGVISLPSATSVNSIRTGFPIFIKNISSSVATIDDAGGNDLFIMNPGEFYMIQLDDNSTSNGTWIWTNLSQDTLQSAYDNGQSISLAASDPLTISNPSSSIEYNNDSKSYLSKVTSTTQGVISFPLMTLAQRNAIVSPDIGLEIYNSDWNTIDYYDGSAWQTGLTIDKLLAGTNITLTQNGDGTVTVAATGSSPGSSSYYAGWSFQNGGTSTTFSAANTYVPIIIAVGLNDILSSSFVNEVVSISGNNTPCFRYTGSTTQYFEFNLNLFVRGAVAAQKTYQFQASIQRADTSIVQTGFVSGSIVLQDLIFPYAVPLSGIVQLNTGDRVFISVQNKTDTSSVVVQGGNADILNVDASEQIAMVWTTVSGTSQSMSPSNGYIPNNAGLVTLTLPTTANVGSEIRIEGKGAGGWLIAQNAGQTININSSTTTSGVGGSVASTNRYNGATLICITQDTVFNLTANGTLTVV